MTTFLEISTVFTEKQNYNSCRKDVTNVERDHTEYYKPLLVKSGEGSIYSGSSVQWVEKILVNISDIINMNAVWMMRLS